MTLAVDDTWNRITAWLDDHAPAVASCVSPPASPSEIEAAESELGQELPADLVSWWHHANGMRVLRTRNVLLPTLYAPLSITDAIATRRGWLRVADEVFGDPQLAARQAGESAGSPVVQFLPHFLPIADDGAGSNLFVDTRPGPLHCCVMEWNRDDGCFYPPCWPSVAAMLADVADALEHGTESLRWWAALSHERGLRATGYLPVVTEDGRIRWDPAEQPQPSQSGTPISTTSASELPVATLPEGVTPYSDGTSNGPSAATIAALTSGPRPKAPKLPGNAGASGKRADGTH